MNRSHKPLLITTGEPAGIGMDIVIDVLTNHAEQLSIPLIICADKHAFAERVALLQKQGMAGGDVLSKLTMIDGFDKVGEDCHSSAMYLLHVPCCAPVTAGKLNPANAMMVKHQLDIAHELAMMGRVGAIITAPIQKSVMIEGGITLDNGSKFSGHTEYFMHKAGVNKVVMMLANSKMKVALVTTHIPLRDVADAITAKEVRQTVQITYDEMVAKFGVVQPKILVCGLNPHAGEDGHLGDEELIVINPVLQEFRDKGMDVSLAMPADTLFTDRHLANTDAVIAMYHDQGLAPLKSHGFGDTVNITLGLTYVRTSVDHGTALDLAGTGRASSSSLRRAIEMAVTMA